MQLRNQRELNGGASWEGRREDSSVDNWIASWEERTEDSLLVVVVENSLSTLWTEILCMYTWTHVLLELNEKAGKLCATL